MMHDYEKVQEMSMEIDGLLTAKEHLSKRLERAHEEIASLRAWKESVMPIMSPLQEIGKAIGVRLGETIHGKILPYIIEQKRVIAELKEDNQLLRRKIENHIIMSEDFKAEYNDWLDSLNVEVNDVK